LWARPEEVSAAGRGGTVAEFGKELSDTVVDPLPVITRARLVGQVAFTSPALNSSRSRAVTDP
jgi:hypothetical protein